MFTFFSFIFTFWFWIDFIFFGLLLACVVNEKPVLGIFVFGLFLTAIQFLTDFDVIGFVKTHPEEIGLGSICYLPIGLGWAYFRWYLKIQDIRRSLLDEKESFLNNEYDSARRSWVRSHANLECSTVQYLSSQDLINHTGIDNQSIENEVNEKWEKHVRFKKPIAGEHKTTIVNWIAYWPFSMFWTLVDDFATWCGRQIYNLVGGAFQRMSDKQFDKL